MNTNLKKQTTKRTEALPREITTKTQAAINVVQMAVSLGFFDRLLDVISGRCGRLFGDAFDSPRPGEGRIEKWRGEERVGTASLDPVSTTASGESSLLDQRDRERWRRLEAKERRRRQLRHSGGGSREAAGLVENFVLV